MSAITRVRGAQLAQSPQPNVATPHHKNPFAPKPRRQRPQQCHSILQMRDNLGMRPRKTREACTSLTHLLQSSMTFHITVQPSGRHFEAQPGEVILNAAIRDGIGMPYGCKDGACGSCKCKKLSGTVVHGPHQSKALTSEEAAAGMILTCCAIAQSDVVLESKQVTEVGAFPIKKIPVRVSTLQKLSSDVAVLRLQLPATEPFQFHAGQYVEFLLRDGDRRSLNGQCTQQPRLTCPH